MSPSKTEQLTAAGVSIWLDDLSRNRIGSGGLQRLIDERNVVGVTTNPTIFAKALSESEAYTPQLRALAEKGIDLNDAVFTIMSKDVSDAADILRPAFDASNGFDGRVSIEVQPDLARDTQKTIEQANQLWTTIDRRNLLVKIPATHEGLEAITEATAAGISVNVTLIFSLQRYREVINAYLVGLEKAMAAGIDLSTIHSVASFFVSRVDTEIDKRLNAIGTPEALALKGKAGVANARLAYRIYEETFTSERARLLLAVGANKQRPLWASTGVKIPRSPTLFTSTNSSPTT